MYHINRNGSNSGPYTETVFFQMLASGQVQPTDLVWKEGEPEWRPATDYPGLSRSGPPAMPPQDPYSSPYTPPGAAVHMHQTGPPLPTYLWQSIVVTILCCWPLGIPAIVFAASVNGKQNSGNYAAAKEASDKARFWCWLAFGLGLPLSFLVVFAKFKGDQRTPAMPLSRMAVRLPITLALLGLGAVLLVFLYSRNPEQNSVLPSCPVHSWTGYHCPGCGSTRATHALLHGDVAGAWRKNPLLLVVLPFLGVAVLRSWWQWVRGGAFRDALVERWSARVAMAVLILIFLFTLLRNLPGPDRWLAPH